MKSSFPLLPPSARLDARLAFGAALLVTATVGCAQLESDQGPTVTVPAATIVASGSHSLAVGMSLTIAVTTKDGTDSGYTFTSAHPEVANVDTAGVVTGISAGETEVEVTGDDTLAKTTFPVVVLAPSQADQVPYYDRWMMSAHADETALAFNDWNHEGQVPTTCARCHSSEGFVDYLGGDGSSPGVVDTPAPTKSVIRCVTCHNTAADKLTSVTFPSGVTVSGLGGEARCMTCHQGRSSGPAVDAAITAAAPTDDDTPAPSSPSRTSTITRPQPPSTRAARTAATNTQTRSTTCASATWTATTPASAATTRTRPRSSSTPAAAVTPGLGRRRCPNHPDDVVGRDRLRR